MSLTGTLIITGAAGGIGTGFVSELLKTPHALTHHCIYIIHPSAPGSLQSILDKHAPRGHQYEILSLDLSKLSDIRAATTSINSRIASHDLPPLRGLLLIAGGVFISRTAADGIDFSPDGLEMTFAVNYLANFALVLNLLSSMDGTHARIIFMGSFQHDPSFPTSRHGNFKEERYHILFKEGGLESLATGRGAEKVRKGDEFGAAMRRYGTSKLLMCLFMYELQRRLLLSPKLSKVSILASDPAAVGGTNLFSNFPLWLYLVLNYVLVPVQMFWTYLFRNGRFRTKDQVGRDLIFACFDEKTLGKAPGAKYLDGTDVRDSSPESHDERKQRELWDGCLELARSGLEDDVLVGEVVTRTWPLQ